MTRPTIILDAHWRELGELFAEDDLASLRSEFNVIWGRDAPMPPDALSAALPDAEVIIAATPKVDATTLQSAPKLRVVIEVSGAFPDTIDYDACAAAGVTVLSCAPGFRQAVAEMGVAMALAGARGLVWEHEATRAGTENWLSDQAGRDFTLFRASVGFLGFGQIAQETVRLLAPFAPRVVVHDPWLPDAVAADYGVRKCDLADLMAHSRCLFVTAVPTSENRHMIDAEALAQLPDSALVVLISRAHLVDVDALIDEVRTGRIRAAMDVYPCEPLAADDPLRGLQGLILSPHRAAAVTGGRQLIGHMILQDLRAIFSGKPPQNLGRADPDRIKSLAGVGDAASVSDMASKR